MENLPQEIPAAFYYLVGILIISNIGAIITIGRLGIRLTWWLAKLDSRVEEAHAEGRRANRRIDGFGGAPRET